MKNILKVIKNKRGSDFMRKKAVPVGIEDFKELIQEGYYYIDKTLLIDEC